MCHKGDSAGNLVNILDLTVQHGTSGVRLLFQG